jgi:hypothetical protein
MRKDIIPELSGGVIFHQLQQAELMIDNEEDGFVRVETLEVVGWLLGHFGRWLGAKADVEEGSVVGWEGLE